MTSFGPGLLTGHPLIDAQHRELFSRLEQLHVAMLRGDRSETHRLLQYLGEHVVEHFSAEERVMRETCYPGYEEHRLEHEAFTATYEVMWSRLEAKGASAALMLDAKEWVAGWATRHISGTDASLAAHLRSTPVPEAAPAPARRAP